jgi:hypothetical protein
MTSLSSFFPFPYCDRLYKRLPHILHCDIKLPIKKLSTFYNCNKIGKRKMGLSKQLTVTLQRG